jgi:hypothetical protein
MLSFQRLEATLEGRKEGYFVRCEGSFSPSVGKKTCSDYLLIKGLSKRVCREEGAGLRLVGFMTGFGRETVVENMTESSPDGSRHWCVAIADATLQEEQ